MTRRRTLAVAALALLAVGAGVAWRWNQAAYRAGSPYARAVPWRSTVIFVVLDNVRADHLALCGYDRPTSRSLDALVADGASFTCEARAPGDWTLPSHASFFTGQPVVVHGAHALPAGGVALGQGTSEQVRPLDDQLPTLAEHFAEIGYQTIMVSGNPVLGDASGLQRGFEHAQVARRFGGLYGDDLLAALDLALRADVDPTRPLFLFLNIADAHQPWERVPSWVKWAGTRRALRLKASTTGSFWQRFYRGELSAAGQREFLAWYRDAYDFGVFRADRTLGAALDRLRALGWLRWDTRLVVSSDHGELLGEHNLIDHGHYLFDENQRVPLLVWDGGRGPSMPEPVSALHAFELARDGAFPAELGAVEAVAWPHVERAAWSGGRAYDVTSAALWTEDGQTLWMDHQGDPPAALAALVAAARASEARAVEVDPAVMEMLQAAGYVESSE